LSNGGMVSLFQPGWPLVLTPGMAIGLPYLVNPILGALLLWPSYRIALRVFSRHTARLAIIVILISPFFVFMSASYMAHSLSALLTIIALDQALYYRFSPKHWRGIIIGLCIGGLFTIRAYNAILLLAPLLAVASVDLIKGRIKAKAIGLATIAALLLIAVQLLTNWHLTDSPLRFGQDEYFSNTERITTCHRLGFGPDVGCRYEHGRFSFFDGFYFKDALGVTAQRLRSLSLNLLGTPLALAFLLTPIAIGPFRRETFGLYILLASLIVGYFFFYYHGNCYGPRFYYEAMPALGILIALGVSRLDTFMENAAKHVPRIQHILRAIAPTLILTLIVFSLGWLHPKLWDTYHGFRGISNGLQELTEENDIHNAVILLHGRRASFSSGLNSMSPAMNDDVIYAQHLWHQSVQLMYQFPERDFYRHDPARNTLAKLKKHPYEGIIFIEAETKEPPFVTPHNGFAEHQNITEYTPDKKESAQLYFRDNTLNSYFNLTQTIFESGEYVVDVAAMRGPHYGDWTLSLNQTEIKNTFNGYDTHYHVDTWRSAQPVHLEKGMATLRFAVSGRHANAAGHKIGIDSITLRRVPDGIDKPIPLIEDVGYMKDGQFVPVENGQLPWFRNLNNDKD